MKVSILWLIRLAVILTALLSSVLAGQIWLLAIEPGEKIIMIILIMSLLLVCIGFYWFLSKQVQSTLASLSETIQNLIDDNPGKTFTELDDTLLSKLQGQVMKLSEILKSHNLRLIEEKEGMAAIISDISHQLKTPLTNLNMYNDFLLDDGLSETKRAEFTQYMQGQIKKLNWLMESLIKMSRLETGIISLYKQRSPIAQTVLKAISMVSLKAEHKNIDISFDGDEKLVINHDASWTQEAIFNILDNAVKYSPPHTEIAVVLTRYELFCRLDIIDKGIGIPEPEINRIFARFYRGGNAKESEGVGLGLFLARRIVAEQGGYLKVKSILDQGTMFSVYIPLDIAD